MKGKKRWLWLVIVVAALVLLYLAVTKYAEYRIREALNHSSVFIFETLRFYQRLPIAA